MVTADLKHAYPPTKTENNKVWKTLKTTSLFFFCREVSISYSSKVMPKVKVFRYLSQKVIAKVARK